MPFSCHLFMWCAHKSGCLTSDQPVKKKSRELLQGIMHLPVRCMIKMCQVTNLW